MKKNVLTRYKAAIIYGIFGLFIGINVLMAAAHAHAASINVLSTLSITVAGDTPTLPAIVTPTVIPIETPTLIPITPTTVPINTPTPVPTTAPAPTPTAQPTQKPVPTAAPTVPVPVLPPSNGGGIFPGPGVTPVPSPTVKATATATATPTTSVEATPTASTSASTSNINDQGKQEGSGISTTIVPVAIGSVLLLLIGGLTCFMFLRKPDAKLAYARVPWRPTERPAWASRQGSRAPFVTPTPAPIFESQAAFAAASIPDVLPMLPSVPTIPMPTNPHRAITPTPAPSFANGPQSTVTMPTSPQHDLLPTTPPVFIGEPQALHAQAPANERYTPSDLKPITTSLPKQVSGPMQNNSISTSDMNPLPLDNFDLAQILPRGNDKLTDYKTVPAQEDASPAFSPLMAPTIQDDPVLETIMRQAQMGLYALPNQDPIDPEEIS